ncbi:endonuclease/exonuclease/phosphatase family protein [Pontixanthobacter sp.]|uniref:endonuclease/exonuclease/phosphatase family protein n=1 Tax=Pontixanthobacter sp. TaxID=2792078 RepID=UPI003C7DCAE7
MILTFASYNIHKAIGNDMRRDPARIIAVLREIDADIIALQEADLRIGQRASVLPRALIDDTDWKIVPVATRPRSIGWHGNAILVRRAIEVLNAQAVHLPSLEPRGAVRTDLSVAGSHIRVFGAHLDLSGLRRRAQIKAILGANDALPANYPAVIMGDFNQWGLHTGAMQEFGPAWQSLPLGKSFPSRQPLACLDRIVASAEWRCSASGVHHSAAAAQASDHLPVLAQLHLPI